MRLSYNGESLTKCRIDSESPNLPDGWESGRKSGILFDRANGYIYVTANNWAQILKIDFVTCKIGIVLNFTTIFFGTFFGKSTFFGESTFFWKLAIFGKLAFSGNRYFSGNRHFSENQHFPGKQHFPGNRHFGFRDCF